MKFENDLLVVICSYKIIEHQFLIPKKENM